MRRLRAKTGKQLFVTALCMALLLSFASDAMAQGRQTGTLRGNAQDSTGAVLPGVTVTVTSDALQGTRTAVTDVNGNYEILGLPNGAYTVSFELQGFTTVENTATVPLGGVIEANVAMQVGAVAEAVQVTAVVPTPLATTEIAQNITKEEVDVLPMGRNPFRIAELAPGLTDNTVNNGQLTINGSFAYDNVFLIDGVDTNDNLFGTSNNLFIEDAIEESQVLTSGISAEYGRFQGGVVNIVTKSGGNRFSGSFRTNMNKPDWVGETPFDVEQGNENEGTLKNNTTYETTIGGPVVQDRLWFFYANRWQDQAESETFDETGIAYERTTENRRNQFKLTGTIAPGHTLEGSYLRNSTAQGRPTFSFSIDPATIISRTLPNDLMVGTYRGAVTNNLFIEGQFSQREFGFRDTGGTSTNILDSPFITLTQALGHYNAPYFDSTDPEDRNNRQFTGSATLFVPTAAGTHSIKGGFEHFRSTNTGGNSQSSTGYVFDADYAVDASGTPRLDSDGRLIPTFVPFANLIENWIPSRGAKLDIDTLSFYVNDNWQVNDNLSLNLGIRAETVDSTATGNISAVDHSTVVPRLGAAYDVMGDGKFTLQTTYSHYAGKYNEAQFAGNSNVGNPDVLLGVYVGPPGEGRDFAPGFDPNNYFTVFGLFPTQNVVFADNLASPVTKEFTVSGGAQIGARGYAKVTYINRRASDFVEDFVSFDNGTINVVSDGFNVGTFTNNVFRNTDLLTRDYDALQIQTRVHISDRIMIDGSYTAQLKNEGNFEGENTNQPAISSAAFDYPEITPADRYFPTGRLDEFQRHKLRVYGIYNQPLGGFGNVDIGAIWRVNSGLTYSLRSSGVGVNATQQGILNTVGYPDSPSSRTIYYSQGRGSESFKGYGLLDLSVNYNIPIWDSLSPWFKVEIFNALNNDKQIAWNTTVRPDTSGPVDSLGIPTTFTEGASFGEATSVNHYPNYLPALDGLRAFQMAFGIRW